MQEKKQHWWTSDYSLKEKVAFFRDRVCLPSNYTKTLPSIAETHRKQLKNTVSDKKIKMVFLGDILNINGWDLEVDDNIKNSISNADIMVYNQEGVITEKRRILAVAHDHDILEKIKSLAPNAKILANVANNHSGDFGLESFLQSNEQTENFGFNIFGSAEKPFIDVDQFRFFGCTQWSNQAFDEIINFRLTDEVEKFDRYRSSEKYNIFLPHWGYEMQLMPTKQQCDFTDRLIGWDLVVGNHSHSPQPVVYNSDKQPELIAYSLGNFAFVHYNPNHFYGAILVLEFDVSSSKPVLLSSDYMLTIMDYIHSEKKRTIKINPIDQLNYAKLRRKIMLRPSYLSFFFKHFSL
ncbi:MAG: CapA family protein [Bacteroidales bacterium]|nr:CapA family protein [Bacteroidales bacterium]